MAFPRYNFSSLVVPLAPAFTPKSYVKLSECTRVVGRREVRDDPAQCNIGEPHLSHTHRWIARAMGTRGYEFWEVNLAINFSLAAAQIYGGLWFTGGVGYGSFDWNVTKWSQSGYPYWCAAYRKKAGAVTDKGRASLLTRHYSLTKCKIPPSSVFERILI